MEGCWCLQTVIGCEKKSSLIPRLDVLIPGLALLKMVNNLLLNNLLLNNLLLIASRKQTETLFHFRDNGSERQWGWRPWPDRKANCKLVEKSSGSRVFLDLYNVQSDITIYSHPFIKQDTASSLPLSSGFSFKSLFNLISTKRLYGSRMCCCILSYNVLESK